MGQIANQMAFELLYKLKEKIKEKKSEQNSTPECIIAACGNDCSACPRYNKEPYTKTEAELAHTAELWYKIGYRDHIVAIEEISCTGCNVENWCRYKVAVCANEKHIEHCGQCPQYPCDNIKECFEVTKSFESCCSKVCTKEEYDMISKAFFEAQLEK